MSDTTVTEGWRWPLQSRKAHYFTESGRSLCMKWLYMGDLTRAQSVSEKRGVDDCAECHKRLLKRQPSNTGSAKPCK